MTVWTCNLLWKHHAAGDFRPRLWGDDDGELLMVLYGVGASMDDLQPNTSWENYLITPEQQAQAIAEYGVVLTDYLEPRLQRAVREGDAGMIRSIEISRAAAGRSRAPLRHAMESVATLAGALA